MATWAIGDIQGCYDPFQTLLEKIAFDPGQDRLWIAGDLVNRGKGSLETLEYLYDIQERTEVVLGNHDLMLIAAYYGFKKSNPTIEPILASPNAKTLIEWLRRQQFLHVDHELGYCMAHAGISPVFDLEMAITEARRLEARLQGDDASGWLEQMFKMRVDRFDAQASEVDRDSFSINAFTRMRFCHEDLRLDFDQKGPPTSALRDEGLLPWFEIKTRPDIGLKSIFGHWSTLGLYEDDEVLALDTGCLWGRQLSAARIDRVQPEIVSVECPRI